MNGFFVRTKIKDTKLTEVNQEPETRHSEGPRVGIGCQRGRGVKLELEWEDSSERVLLHAIRGRQMSQREMSDAGNPSASVSSEDRESWRTATGPPSGRT